MSNQCFLDRLQLDNDHTLLIQGLPSSVEKIFAKLSYSKNVTPLLKRKKIDFALLFAINGHQLCSILKEVFPALHEHSKLWIAYPKSSSKIVSDLNRNCEWSVVKEKGYVTGEELELDNVWIALQFIKEADAEASKLATVSHHDSEDLENGRAFEKKLSVLPAELNLLFKTHKEAKDFFSSLPPRNQKEYLTWIKGAKKEEAKKKRLEETLEKLLAGKMNPLEA